MIISIEFHRHFLTTIYRSCSLEIDDNRWTFLFSSISWLIALNEKLTNIQQTSLLTWSLTLLLWSLLCCGQRTERVHIFPVCSETTPHIWPRITRLSFILDESRRLSMEELDIFEPLLIDDNELLPLLLFPELWSVLSWKTNDFWRNPSSKKKASSLLKCYGTRISEAIVKKITITNHWMTTLQMATYLKEYQGHLQLSQLLLKFIDQSRIQYKQILLGFPKITWYLHSPGSSWRIFIPFSFFPFHPIIIFIIVVTDLP